MKQRIIQKLTILLMMLMLVITAVTITKPLTVHATEDPDYNGKKGSDSNEVGTGTIGASTTNNIL